MTDEQKFYYVKLSCPKDNDNGKFMRLMTGLVNQDVLSSFKINNIPNNLLEASIGDVVILQIGGDSSKKRTYFTEYPDLQSFDNGIYAICILININSSEKEVELDIYPLKSRVTKVDLFIYPQFLDNLGCASKGIPNQAGLYQISNEVAFSFLDFAHQNAKLGVANQVLKGFQFEGYLKDGVSDFFEKNRQFSGKENLPPFIEKFLAKETEKSVKTSIKESKINAFAFKVFQHFYSKLWLEKIINESEPSDSVINGNQYQSLKFGVFSKLIGHFSTEQTDESLRNGDGRRLSFFSSPIFSDNRGFYYFSNQWNGNGDYSLTFENLKSHFESNFPCSLYEKDGIFYLETTEKLIDTTPISKPFLLLAGISGTGKSRFVIKQAEKSRNGSQENNLSIVAVRPDWHEPSDLLGYVSRIDGVKYVPTKVLKFIIDAWKAVAPNASLEGHGALNTNSLPYWLCLDEMNLAPVEQYFADYLSALESRKFVDGEYSCNALLDTTVLDTKGAEVQSDLGLNDYPGLWEFFCKNGIGIPPNLIVAGTVNMDETTHGFSRKVIDRAITLDFGEFFPNDYDHFFTGQAQPKTFTYSLEMQASVENENSSKSVEFLKKVNGVLKNTPFELAYRALNELLLSVNAFAPESEDELQAVWDDFLMTKVLPRIDGDEDKLTVSIDGATHNLLDKISDVLTEQLGLIWGDDKQRVDLLRVDSEGKPITNIACRSRKKIEWMKARLEANTFTSYWP